MLVSLRRRGESIRLGEDIEITVLDLTPAKVKLGITAPREVRITHTEIVLVEEENTVACRPPARVDAALRRLARPLRARQFSSSGEPAR